MKASVKTVRAGIAMTVARAGRAPNAGGLHHRAVKATGVAPGHAEIVLRGIAPEDRALAEIAHATGGAMTAATMIAHPARRRSRRQRH